ncbi:unnamed protein product [Notodromas monacha]|uniref:G-protein coupled receptors family 1 profile domain-containing protein n=1 Tax=Notodromas monacha TaxID=399045 RepID=A0A7R9GBV3_9CRUS|nr:unnamed protein product [Notodromas monacha]CAG0915443.1 unnamed protein product [Notodromas monacha]
MMMIALTLERYVAICHPTRTRDANGEQRAYAVVFVVPVLCLVVYLPYMFHAMINDCRNANGDTIYQRRDNVAVQGTIWYNLYQWLLQCIFRLLPVTVLGWLNVCIIVAYRRVCSKRKKMTRRPTGEEKHSSSDAVRLMFLLGVTSCLFFVCMTPVAVLSIMFSTEMYLDSISFQVFRAVANTLEIVNFAMTFYIYCLFSTEFRQTFLQLFGCEAWGAKAINGTSYAAANANSLIGNRLMLQQVDKQNKALSEPEMNKYLQPPAASASHHSNSCGNGFELQIYSHSMGDRNSPASFPHEVQL